MLRNKSIPRCTVIPVIGYPDVIAAVDWLCRTFSFTVRVLVGSHRAQLNVEDGAVIVRELSDSEKLQRGTARSCSVMVRVPDIDQHFIRSRSAGAEILDEPTTYPFGERQYSASDLAGNKWTFTQSVVDIAPEEWGGVAEDLT